MIIKVSNTLTVDIKDDLLLQLVVEDLTYDNPLYKEAKKSGRSTRGLTQVLKNFTYVNGSYLLPRGYFERLYILSKELGIHVEIQDERSIRPFEYAYKHDITLREYQSKALRGLVSHSEGVLSAPAGSGKTIIGIAAILTCGQKSLWITHTKQLLFQFVDRLKSLVNIPESDIGLIYNGNWDTEKPITAALVQTLKTDNKKLASISNNYGTIIADECLVSGTKITLLNGIEKDIESINNGDVTLYGEVSNKFDRLVEETISLRTGHGEIEGTLTHMLPYVSREKETLGLENKLKPFEESDVTFTPMININVNDYLLYLPGAPHVTKHNIGKQTSRLLALIACDGHITKNLKCLQIGITKDKDWFLNEMSLSTKLFNDSDLRTCDCKRGDLIIRNYSKEAIKFVNTYVPAGKKSNIITVPDIIKNASLEEIREYLQVVFDTEGSVTNQVCLTMASNRYVRDIQYLLKKFNIMGRLIPIKRNNGYLRIAITGYDALLFYRRVGFSMERKQNALLNLLKHTSTFVRTVSFKGVVYRCIPVLEKIHSNISKRVYDFTTTEHVFSANNVLSSNCHHQPSTTFTEVINQLNPYYLYGLTATPFRRDGLETLLFQNIGPIRHTIDRSETSSNIIVPTVIKRMLKTSNLPEELTYQTLLALLTKDDYRNSIICTDVVREAKLGNICIVLTERVSHAEILYKKILKQWDKVGIIHGKHSDKLREKTLTSLNNGEITVLTATTQLLGEGFDHPSLNRLFLAQPIRNPAKCEQLVGRVQRTSPGKVDALIYDYIDDHGLTKHQFQNYGTGSSRYNVYKKLGCNIK